MHINQKVGLRSDLSFGGELTGIADKDATKRVKLSPGACSSNDRRSANPGRLSRRGSGSPSTTPRAGDHAPRRHHRLSSVVSATDSHVSATPAPHPANLDERVHSPLDHRSSEHSPVIRASPRDTAAVYRPTPLWHEDQPSEQTGPPRLLPSLSDVVDSHGSLSSGQSLTDLNGYPFPRSYRRDSAGPPPDLIDSARKPPTLSKEQSSAGSISSASSNSYPRTPIEGSLPIHALLSEKPQQPLSSMMQFQGSSIPLDHKSPFLPRQAPDGILSSYTNGKPKPSSAGRP